MKAIVVDDERHTRIFLQTVFDWNALGVTEVMEADNGETALQLIFEHRPELILTDMRMPGKDGVRLLQALTELGYPHRKIVISGYDEYAYMKTAIAYGGFDYFIKPIDEEEVFKRLIEAVRELDAETSKERERQAMEARRSRSNGHTGTTVCPYAQIDRM
ncbi:response regulator [Paenibacillus chungangensis]|uniref:Response regulator n=1 Tax=Paenibacillus chungangensis TaxID=696535 RepID=A0ABW3HUA6_9BACL